MKKFLSVYLASIAVSTLFLGACCGKKDCDASYNLTCDDLILRDPFVFADKNTQKYYIHANALITKTNQTQEEISKNKGKALYCYEGKDLQKWRLVGKSFEAPKNWWGKRDFWAPDMFKFGDKYYVIATFSNNRVIGKFFNNPKADLQFRGCAVLVSDKPEGPYKPLSDKPITPENWSCLDGTLFEEDGKLYMLYCREWTEIGDGAMYAQEISRDLTKMIGEPVKLFNASEAPWCASIMKGCLVTDGIVVNKSPDGKLYMTWSSFSKIDGKLKYVVGLARSENGKLFGKWTQYAKPLNNDNGGHAMLFKDFDGNLKISYHAENVFPEKTVIRKFRFTKDGAEISD